MMRMAAEIRFLRVSYPQSGRVSLALDCFFSAAAGSRLQVGILFQWHRAGTPTHHWRLFLCIAHTCRFGYRLADLQWDALES